MNNNSSDISIDEQDKKCAPGLKFEAGSCARLYVIVELAKAYNEYTNIKEDKIKLNSNLETLNPTKYKNYLLKELKKRIGDKCETQKCWSEQSFIDNMNDKAREEFEKYTFRPNGPEGKFEWLNTYNINDVMYQYEKLHKDFKYLGTVPMDFDDLPSLGIKNLDFDQLYKNGKKKLGIVFNLDESWKSGSHWVGLYSDLENGGIYYFDSYGTIPESRVRILMRRIARYLQNKNNNYIAKYNKTRHQYKNSECGVYSIHFIIKMLNGEKFEKLCGKKIPDDAINKCRKQYFINT
jgi:hypothetical protein